MGSSNDQLRGAMRLNWLAYNYRPWDGYGRYSLYMIDALRQADVDVRACFAGAADAPFWLQAEWGVSFYSAPTISCLPPYYLRKLPQGSAPHWLLTMTEGSECPDGWADIINESGVERVIVPCEHNAEAFREGGVQVPISVVPGGTDPDEFPLLDTTGHYRTVTVHNRPRPSSTLDTTVHRLSSDRPQPSTTVQRPYTFLALADRGKRKGWIEAYDAFFAAFGTVDDTPDVRLVIKCRPGGNDLVDLIVEKCADIDPRITFLREDLPNIADFYAMGDCFVIPSRSEGWGMPHREAAMMGLPVITQAYSGMADGHTEQWAIVVEKGRMEPVDATKDKHIAGEWRVCDRDELAARMRQCYDSPQWAAVRGAWAAMWLREHQTWHHSAAALLQLLQPLQGGAEHVLEREYA